MGILCATQDAGRLGLQDRDCNTDSGSNAPELARRSSAAGARWPAEWGAGKVAGGAGVPPANLAVHFSSTS